MRELRDRDDGTATLTLEASDVTGTQQVTIEGISAGLSAGSLAEALADRLELPDNVSWALRLDSTSAYLDDTRSIGDQIGTETRVTLTPRAHLG